MEVLLVTTRQTRRWIIPKGWPIKGLKPPKSAAREAYEEAGIARNLASFGSILAAAAPAKSVADPTMKPTVTPVLRARETTRPTVLPHVLSLRTLRTITATNSLSAVA